MNWLIIINILKINKNCKEILKHIGGIIKWWEEWRSKRKIFWKWRKIFKKIMDIDNKAWINRIIYWNY